MKKFGLIGYPLSHSFSPNYFARKFENEGIEDCEYLIYEIDSIDKFSELIKDPDFVGVNVTIPYKEAVINFLDELDAEAEKIGAVNTIHFENGKSKGYNTDVYGFETSLVSFLGKDLGDVSAFVLGTGGASKAIQHVLSKLEIPFELVSRKEGYLNYGDISEEKLSNTKLIINTTPLGTYPNVDDSPLLPYKAISSNHYLFDLVYNPEKTLFLKRGEQFGASILNGYQMLVLQAEKAWEIWNKK